MNTGIRVPDKSENHDTDRLRAIELAESVQSCWAAVINGDTRPRLALEIALEFAESRLDITTNHEFLTAGRVYVMFADAECHNRLCNGVSANFAEIYGARRALEAVLWTLADKVDLDAVGQAVVEAMRYGRFTRTVH